MKYGEKKNLALLIMILSSIMAFLSFFAFIPGAILLAGRSFIVVFFLLDFFLMVVFFTAMGLSIARFVLYFQVQKVYYHNEAALRENLRALSSKEGVLLEEMEGLVLRSLLARSDESDIKGIKRNWKDILELCIENKLISGHVDKQRDIFVFTGKAPPVKNNGKDIDLNKYKKTSDNKIDIDEYGQLKE